MVASTGCGKTGRVVFKASNSYFKYTNNGFILNMDQATAAFVISIVSVIVSALVSFLVTSFRIGIYTNKVDTNCSDITELKKEKTEIRDKVIACETLLKERGPLTKRRSPVDLTERGNRILTDSKGKDFIDTHYIELKNKVEEKKPQTSYDIQESSKVVIEELKNDSRINPIKEYLFQEGMDLEDLIEVLGIYLRNLILKEKNIDVNDIDKHQ